MVSMKACERRILVVDDEVDFAKGISRQIKAAFPECNIEVAHTGPDAVVAVEAFQPHVMLLDLRLPGMDGHEVLHATLAKQPGISVVILTGHGTVATAVNALHNGAWDFLTKPVRGEDLIRSLSKAFERSQLLGENKRLTQLMHRSGVHKSLIGDSEVMLRLMESLRAVAAADYTVLVRGESGTGKELVAESVHKLSDRAAKPLIRVNCPAIPEHLLESELFGHVKGAFTGAISARKGLFVEASGGVLLLDEIGDMPLGVQTKLLRVLQDGEVRPVGASQSIRTDTRVIAVTNQNLEAKIKDGTFREDLYYRLNVLCLRTPSLRERRGDIPLLAAHFLQKTCEEIVMPAKRFAPELLAALCHREWPGNVRELQNIVRRMAVFCPGPVLGMEHLPFGGEDALESPICEHLPYKEAKNKLVDAFTRDYVQDLLVRSDGNVSEAARLSGLERVSLQKILRRIGVEPGAFKKGTII